jgi:hypothetical protein
MQKFDRNNFKSFVENNKLSEKKECLYNHSEIVKNKALNFEHKSSFRSISELELNETYSLIGSLCDSKIKILDYIECNDKPNDFWNSESKIATNFYPYHICAVYTCKYCNKLILVYTEESVGVQRMRTVKSELIIEEPSNCTLKITEDYIPNLLSYLKLNKDEFEKMLEENIHLNRINSNFDVEKLIVKKNYENTFLFISSRNIIYELIDRFQ